MLETKVICEKQDYKHLSWSKICNTSGTNGSFLKATSALGEKKIYFKLSNYDSIKGVVGIESVNEIIIDRLLTILGVEHLHYQLIHADILVDGVEMETYLCASEDFKDVGEDKTPLDEYYNAEKTTEKKPLEFCVNKGWEDYVYKMIVVDFLILNRDRHGANIEVLRNKKKQTLRLAPLFDHGVSLLFSCLNDDAVMQYDVMADNPVNSYLGGRSAIENLRLIPKDKLPRFNPLKESDKEVLFEDIDGIFSVAMREKVWEMIYKRWKYYESICNQ